MHIVDVQDRGTGSGGGGGLGLARIKGRTRARFQGGGAAGGHWLRPILIFMTPGAAEMNIHEFLPTCGDAAAVGASAESIWKDGA